MPHFEKSSPFASFLGPTSVQAFISEITCNFSVLWRRYMRGDIMLLDVHYYSICGSGIKDWRRILAVKLLI